MSIGTPSNHLWVPVIKIVRPDGPAGTERIVVLANDDNLGAPEPPPAHLDPQD